MGSDSGSTAIDAGEGEGQVLALLQDLQRGPWPARKVAVERTELALDHVEERTGVRKLRDALLLRCEDEKWEVRRAAALALRHSRLPGGKLIQRALRALARDVYPEVRAAAEESLSRRAPASGSWEPTDRDDRALVDFVGEQVRELANRRLGHRRIYEAISECGEHYYRLLASDTTHQIRSRLQPIVSALGRLRRHLDETGRSDEETTRHLEHARRHADRLERLLDDLRQYTRESRTMNPICMKRLLRGALADAQQRADATSLELDGVQERLDVPERLVIEGDAQALREAFVNLIVNAYYATSPAGELRVFAQEADGSVRVVVEDSGCGMTQEQLEFCTKRYRTTRASAGGSGLGLPIAKRVVEAFHRGSLEIESEPGNGTRVVVELPLRQEPT